MEKKHQETKYDGKKAIIIDKNHPHHDSTAICMGVDLTNIGWGMKFKKVNSDEEFYVFDGKGVRWVGN